MKKLITLLFFSLLSYAGEYPQITITYKDGLSDGWVKKVDVSVNNLVGIGDSEEQRCFWNGYTNALGELWYAVTFYKEQLKGNTATNVSDLLNLKVPQPFRGKIKTWDGLPVDGGLVSTNAGTL